MEPDEVLRTRTIMSHRVETNASDACALDASDKVAKRRDQHLVIVDAKTDVVGFVSDRDRRSAQSSRLLVPHAVTRRKALGRLRVEDVMSAHPPTVREDAPIEEAVRKVPREWLGCLRVVGRRGTLVGVVMGSDVTKLALELVRKAASARVAPSR